MTLDWLRLAAVLGAAQGVFLAVVLATQQRNRTANRLLAVLMVAFSIHLASGVYYAAGLVGHYPQFFGVSYPLPLMYGPLVYLYAITASDRTRRLQSRDALHFIPFAAVALASVAIYAKDAAGKLAFLGDLQRGILPLYMQITEPFKYVSGVSYAAITLLFLRRHRARVKDSYSSVERVNLDWLLQLATGSAVIWGLATTFAMTDSVRHPIIARSDDIIALAMAVMVYATGYIALRQPEIFNFAAPPPAPAEPRRVYVPEATESSEPPSPRYERSGLTDKEAETLKRGLIAAMEKDSPAPHRRRWNETPHDPRARDERRIRLQIDLQCCLPAAHRPYAVGVPPLARRGWRLTSLEISLTHHMALRPTLAGMFQGVIEPVALEL